MKTHSLLDYAGCILFKGLTPLARILPKGFFLSLGRWLGGLFYYFDLKHRAIVYSNLKTVFGARLSPSELSGLTKNFYRTFGENLMELFFIPVIDKDYINKYITFKGLENIARGFKRGKGVILLGLHEGSWELSNSISASLGFPFSLFVRNQRYPRLDRLLNSYRRQKGYRVIQRRNQLRQLIDALKNNQAVGMTLDQGGKSGVGVNFLGRDASMATGAVRLALKYGATIICSFYTRVSGPYIKVIIEPPFEITQSGNFKNDLRDNVQRLADIFEKYLLRYPKEYLWSYKVWKYSRERRILILDDRKTGHLRQAQALAEIISAYLKARQIKASIDTVDIIFKSKFAQYALTASGCLAANYTCQGCLWCLRKFLSADTYNALKIIKPDVVISCGSATAAVNLVISRENTAKSVVIMRPSIFSTKRFDLVIMPRHDNPAPKKNVLITEGALNLIDADYLTTCILNLKSKIHLSKDLVLGLLIGGDTRYGRLSRKLIKEIIGQLKELLKRWDGEILITTSRRSSSEIEQLIKEEFKDYPRGKLLVIANEHNLEYAVGGIIGLSQVVVVSGESISMVSEAASAGRYIVVFKARYSPRHVRFLYNLARGKYIYLSDAGNLSSVISELLEKRPRINLLQDKVLIKEALGKII